MRIIFSLEIIVCYLQYQWRWLIAGGSTAIPSGLHNPAPDWISERMWKDILSLSILPKFSLLATEFSSHLEGFKRVFDSSEPHREHLPGHWDADLDAFQKMLVLKCVRTDKITNAMQVGYICTCKQHVHVMH